MRAGRWWWSTVAVALALRGPEQRGGCDGAVMRKAPFAALVCLAEYRATGDPATGARASRALEDLRIEDATIGMIARAVGDSAAGADAWNALGDVYRHAHDNPASIAAYRRAFAHRAPSDLAGRIHDVVGLYNRYHDDEQYLPAMRYMALAYALARQLGDPHERAYVVAGVANIVFDLGDLPLARELADEATTLIDEDSEYWPYLLGLRACIASALGRPRLAVAEQEKAIAAAERDPRLAHWVLGARITLAWWQIAAGDRDAAAATLARAVIAPSDPYVAELRARRAIVASRLALEPATALRVLDEIRDAPPDWITQLGAARGRVLAKLGRLPEAETAFETAIQRLEAERGELQVDTLKPWLIASAREPFEDLFTLLVGEGRAADALAVVQRAQARSVVDGLVAQATTGGGSIPQRLSIEGDRVEGFRALAHALRASQPAAVPDPREELSNVAVATYFAAGGQLWLVMLDHGAARAYRVTTEAPLPRDALPDPGETLYIAVDAPVRDVAFAALRVDGRYLVERNPIAYVPSASVLAIELARTATATGSVVLGDPEGNLPGARTEALAVARQLGVAPLLGAAATRSAVLGARGRHLLHVAGHAEVSATGGALRLADGTLAVGELIDAGATADIVVLTSCASADPLDRDELGPLANGFLAAGARTVVASRWAVPDLDAASFTRDFYAGGGGDDPIAGVAHAQREMIARGVPESVWSTFVVIGASTRTPHGHPASDPNR